MKTMSSAATSDYWVADKRQIHDRVRARIAAGDRVGLVPTMGNLHEGHASLFRLSASENDYTVATIFVNPIQFGPNEDFEAYPRTPADDETLCREAGVDVIFAPEVSSMYPPDATTRVHVADIERPFCGKDRPGHFIGVATVVTKLFHLIPASAAYFGAKDYQQCKVIQRMTRDLDFQIDIRIGPTVREPDGLAMSSRNRYLSPEERAQATCLHRSLQEGRRRVLEGEKDPEVLRQVITSTIGQASLGTIDYVDIRDAETLEPIETVDRPVVAAVAVRFGKARLIDNVVIEPASAR